MRAAGARELLPLQVAFPGKCKNSPALRPRDLRHDVRRLLKHRMIKEV